MILINVLSPFYKGTISEMLSGIRSASEEQAKLRFRPRPAEPEGSSLWAPHWSLACISVLSFPTSRVHSSIRVS